MKIPIGKGRALFLNELGTCGFRSSATHYTDLFWGWPDNGGRRSLRMFVNDGVVRRWHTLERNGWRLTWTLDKVEVLHPDNAARVFRRTMKPYTLLTYQRGPLGSSRQVEVMSYPCPNDDGSVTIMARLTPGDSSTLRELRCEHLRPISFQPTDIPAENPIK